MKGNTNPFSPTDFANNRRFYLFLTDELTNNHPIQSTMSLIDFSIGV